MFQMNSKIKLLHNSLKLIKVKKCVRGFYSGELYFHALKKAGTVLHFLCVNESDYLTSIQGC